MAIRRRLIFLLLIAAGFIPCRPEVGHSADELPPNSGPAALDFPHFPTRMHTFIWRNWNVVATDRIAKVLGTTSDKVAAVAASMGLPPGDPSDVAVLRQRGYITIIRRNWHLLPYE